MYSQTRSSPQSLYLGFFGISDFLLRAPSRTLLKSGPANHKCFLVLMQLTCTHLRALVKAYRKVHLAPSHPALLVRPILFQSTSSTTCTCNSNRTSATASRQMAEGTEMYSLNRHFQGIKTGSGPDLESAVFAMVLSLRSGDKGCDDIRGACDCIPFKAKIKR